MRRLNQRGFTLAELLVAVILMAVVLGGLFALQDALLRDKGKVIREIALRNNADYIRRIVQRELAQATFLMSPTTALGTGPDLSGYKYLDPGKMVCATCSGTWTCRPIQGVSASPNPCVDNVAATEVGNWPTGVQWFRFCLTTAGDDQRFFWYRGNVAPPTAGPATNAFSIPMPACGTAPTTGTMEPVAGVPGAGGGPGLIRVVEIDDEPFVRPRANYVETKVRLESTNMIGAVIETAKAEVSIGMNVLSFNIPYGQ